VSSKTSTVHLCLVDFGSLSARPNFRFIGYFYYRWPNGPDTTGRMTHDTKNTTRTRHDTMDVVSVPARHDAWSCMGRDLDTQCQHKHDTKIGQHDKTRLQFSPTQQQPTLEQLAVAAHHGLLTTQRSAAAVYKQDGGRWVTNPSSFPPPSAAARLVVSAAVPPPHRLF
jgi:hypothetical protein